MTYIKSYKDLIVWQKSIELARRIYVLTSKFPASELYGIVLQMRRAAVSTPSNIAEGYGRNSQKEYAYHISVAYGSLLELETQLILSSQLKLAPTSLFHPSEELIIEVGKMLNVMNAKNKSSNS